MEAHYSSMHTLSRRLCKATYPVCPSISWGMQLNKICTICGCVCICVCAFLASGYVVFGLPKCTRSLMLYTFAQHYFPHFARRCFSATATMNPLGFVYHAVAVEIHRPKTTIQQQQPPPARATSDFHFPSPQPRVQRWKTGQ